jgi:hypothetical protein
VVLNHLSPTARQIQGVWLPVSTHWLVSTTASSAECRCWPHHHLHTTDVVYLSHSGMLGQRARASERCCTDQPHTIALLARIKMCCLLTYCSHMSLFCLAERCAGLDWRLAMYQPHLHGSRSHCAMFVGIHERLLLNPHW